MEKKESLKRSSEQKLKSDTGNTKKPNWISNKAVDIIKLILGICLLPFVYSSTVAFLVQLKCINTSLQNYFWAGVVTFILIYLFVSEPGWLYNFGHKLLEFIFSFFQPLVKVAPYLLPVYTITIFFIYLILAVFIKGSWLINYTMFLFGVSLALHLIFSSKAVRSKKGDILKSNYIFGFSFIYIINLGLFALFLNIIFNNFSFVDFCNDAYSLAGGIFKAVFSQLFKV
ncbi:MAG: hypothetical protein JXL82_02035 [Candidatus Omnitrophica bacterium]|nr:hypothetical protein [Candidatus Omnitrophota bacterium]